MKKNILILLITLVNCPFVSPVAWEKITLTIDSISNAIADEITATSLSNNSLDDFPFVDNRQHRCKIQEQCIKTIEECLEADNIDGQLTRVNQLDKKQLSLLAWNIENTYWAERKNSKTLQSLYAQTQNLLYWNENSRECKAIVQESLSIQNKATFDHFLQKVNQYDTKFLSLIKWYIQTTYKEEDAKKPKGLLGLIRGLDSILKKR